MEQHKKSLPLSLQEVITLADPMKPLTSQVVSDLLGFVGLSVTMLSKTSNLPDVNERLNCIRSILPLIASGRDVSIVVVAAVPLSDAADYLEFQLVSKKPDTTDPTRTP